MYYFADLGSDFNVKMTDFNVEMSDFNVEMSDFFERLKI